MLECRANKGFVLQGTGRPVNLAGTRSAAGQAFWLMPRPWTMAMRSRQHLIQLPLARRAAWSTCSRRSAELLTEHATTAYKFLDS